LPDIGSPLLRFLWSHSNIRGDVISAEGGCQYLAVKKRSWSYNSGRSRDHWASVAPNRCDTHKTQRANEEKCAIFEFTRQLKG
jgi:hypothetical protein